jgi:uncharacterized protein YdhG (YjbR/CyaY superfamily)
MQTYKSVSEYIKKAPKDRQEQLAEVRAIVLKTVPRAQESIAYGMPAYTYNDKPLFYFAAMKGHLGLYPTPKPIQSCKELLRGFSTSKGCVRIPYTQKTPTKIIVALLKERVKEINSLQRTS